MSGEVHTLEAMGSQALAKQLSILVHSDGLVDGGALDLLPQSSSPDHFCMMLTTHVLGGVMDLGSALIRVDPKGQCRFLGGFLELHTLGEKLDTRQLVSSPWLMSAIRARYATSSGSSAHWESVNFRCDGFISVISLREPQMGMLLLGARQPVELPQSSVRLLSYSAEKFLSENRTNPARSSQDTQVDGNNSNIVFSSRQLQVLDLLARGSTNTQIGKALNISASLAKQEVAFITHALQVKTRLAAVVEAQRCGIL